MRVRLPKELLQDTPPAPVEAPRPVRVRIALDPPRHKATHAVMLYGGSYDDVSKKFDPSTPEIEGFTASGLRFFKVKRIGLTHTTLIETGEYDQLEYKCENDMWQMLVKKGRKL